MFKVKKECCGECLFSENKIVSNKRKSQILKDCIQKDTHFVCHKSTAAGGEDCCSGFYERASSQMIRISQRLNMIEFVE